MGGAVFVSAAQSVFVNRLLQTLPSSAPDVDPAYVAILGATELRSVFSGPQLAGIVDAYMVGVRGAFAFGIAVAGSAFVASWLMPIRSIKGGSSKSVATVTA